MPSDTLPKISSLAAPTEEDLAVMRSISADEYRELLAAQIEAGREDIRQGRCVVLNDEAAIRDYFARRLDKYEGHPLHEG